MGTAAVAEEKKTFGVERHWGVGPRAEEIEEGADIGGVDGVAEVRIRIVWWCEAVVWDGDMAARGGGEGAGKVGMVAFVLTGRGEKEKRRKGETHERQAPPWTKTMTGAWLGPG